MWRARSAHRNPSFGRSCASGPLSPVAKASPRGWRSKAAEPEFVGLADGGEWIRTFGSVILIVLRKTGLSGPDQRTPRKSRTDPDVSRTFANATGR